ncbi:PREDICTED: 2S sulfur-rich seed storage protein 2-like [Nelumbo nucifera]|uniref:2S sulfur-rich seed storage protein 2-like n=1 Tax=Nelumbo nucifera TaxID=4432 RepID=A0A1U8AXV2_NELNU|nr:PREDICTED: 2S sulfur-rich seed storage protein 2-like [Nelumbo nucifera]
MARSIILVALLVGLVAIAEASTYRTTVITTIIEHHQSQSEMCREEMQKHPLNECRRYMQSWQSAVLLRGNAGNVPQECCEELENMKDDCMCEGIHQMVQQQHQKYQREEKQQEQMMKKAEKLPSMCGMSQSCKFHGNGF